MTIRVVAQLHRCSYSEARDRMLDGRIKAIRDGRWLRTRREWIEQYVASKTIKPPDVGVIEFPQSKLAVACPISPRAGNYAVGVLKYPNFSPTSRMIESKISSDGGT